MAGIEGDKRGAGASSRVSRENFGDALKGILTHMADPDQNAAPSHPAVSRSGRGFRIRVTNDIIKEITGRKT